MMNIWIVSILWGVLISNLLYLLFIIYNYIIIYKYAFNWIYITKNKMYIYMYKYTYIYSYIYIHIYIKIPQRHSLWSLFDLCVMMSQNVTWCVTHQYIGYGRRNSPQSFFTWQIWMLTTHWNHLGFLISIPGVRNVLQSQEGFLIFF